ncbi:MAG: hypothetical protein K6E62_13765 [Lachnospiraceae bacterium]|nr:hypothetical protein [Lachnospiraceae bacterium]
MNLKERIDEAELILIGIGEEFEEKVICDKDAVLLAYDNLAGLLKDKNYYIVSLPKDGLIFDAGFDKERVAAPFYDEEEAGKEKWDKYLRWLSLTLNRKLFVLELGVGLSVPEVIRWPFEKTVMYNNKATMLRVNGSLPNIPVEISDRATGFSHDSVSFLSCLDS